MHKPGVTHARVLCDAPFAYQLDVVGDQFGVVQHPTKQGIVPTLPAENASHVQARRGPVPVERRFLDRVAQGGGIPALKGVRVDAGVHFSHFFASEHRFAHVVAIQVEKILVLLRGGWCVSQVSSLARNASVPRQTSWTTHCWRRRDPAIL